MGVVHSTERIVYALQLEDNCFYIGETTRAFVTRLIEHLQTEKKALWVKLHPVVAVLQTQPVPGRRLERLWTLEYMQRYGSACVRGGKWCHRYHSARDLREIQRGRAQKYLGERKNGGCAYCLQPGHKGRDCPLRAFPYQVERLCSICREPGHTKAKCPVRA